MKNHASLSSQRLQNAVEKSYSYEEFMQLMDKLLIQKSTTGAEKTESRINYTALNHRRMNRLNKTLIIPSKIMETVVAYKREVLWLVLTESWCGDAAQSLPVINKMASLNKSIDLRITLRDENLELMDEFLTEGSRSIPKLIVTDKDSGEVLATWGPRPAIAGVMAAEYKQVHGSLTPEFKEELQLWYTRDKGLNIMEDVVKLLV